ncbi:MAG: DUF2141 domain-containing protein [Proteobacteria bacterium]|nr:DUF2141 domain-containing protein [Pseudomonadota bacterium]
MKFLSIFWLLLVVPLVSSAVEVTVFIEGLRSAAGHVIIGVYTDAESFANPRNPAYYNNKVDIVDGKAVVVFDLPVGVYAISMFHDANDNKDLDLSWLNIPKEGWGFSRDARPAPTWPNFRDACFEVQASPLRMAINVKHGIW